jgi:prevent-host-death family protein
VARYILIMTKTLTLREANQSFARCIREVEAGEEFVITRNGTPVARLSPMHQRRVLTAEQQAAYERTLQRMKEGWDLGVSRFDRDALHER